MNGGQTLSVMTRLAEAQARVVVVGRRYAPARVREPPSSPAERGADA